jgi:hypothetical protein
VVKEGQDVGSAGIQKIVVVFSSTAASVIVTPSSIVRMIVSATTAGGQTVASGTGHLGGVGEAACRNPNRHPPRPHLISTTRTPTTDIRQPPLHAHFRRAGLRCPQIRAVRDEFRSVPMP